MTLIQLEPSSSSTRSRPQTVDDVMEVAGPRVCDDMTVEVALAVMTSARTGHLLVSDVDGLCTGLVTWDQLTAVRDSAAYTDEIRLRAVPGGRGLFTSPLTTTAEAEHAMRHRRLDVLPVIDEQGGALGVLALAR
ncbi:CBS domain-containing protein [Streptomyces sp. NPDC087908]|uniref:CBS domain-containing protein n=1 Tax=unclassified Streptomyces TaxID=2593676 RepID=UPI0011CE2C87|nr:CBS domain-containing protein [Streptomyces sp. adm13(2018)]TXS12428.1 CBS domain-containing protein [Streptomyces sp. adm13(2018)]